MITQITSNAVALCLLLDLQLVSGVEHVWTGVGSVTYNGNTYTGVGSFASCGEIAESSCVRADGTTISLSGLDPAWLTDALADIQLGAPATLWLAVFESGAIAAAVQIFAGTVDQPTIPIGPDTIAIQIALESKMTNLQRPTMRRYTSSDQRVYYPDDIALSWVEILEDIALLWANNLPEKS